MKKSTGKKLSNIFKDFLNTIKGFLFKDMSESTPLELKYEAAQSVLEQAREMVPVDTGSLRDSGKIEQTENGYRVIFGTGKNRKTDKPIDYATIVHEDYDAQHKVGSAKYLELAAYFVSTEEEFKDLEFDTKYDVSIEDNIGCMVVDIQ